MLSRAALRLPVRRTAVRFFQTTTIKRADFVQQLYLDEVKNFKPTPLTAKDAEGHVRPWSAPAAPAAPASELNIADVSAYESAAVEVEGVEGSSATEAVADDWFVIEEVHEEEH